MGEKLTSISQYAKKLGYMALFHVDVGETYVLNIFRDDGTDIIIDRIESGYVVRDSYLPLTKDNVELIQAIFDILSE